MQVFQEQAKALAKRVKEWMTPTPKPAVEDPTENLKEQKAPGSIVEPAKTRGLQATLLRLLKFSIGINAVLCATIALSLYHIEHQPTKAIYVRGDLKSQIINREVTRNEDRRTVSIDELLFFLHNVITIPYEVSSDKGDTRAAPSLGLIQGLVASNYYAEAEASVQRNSVALRSRGISQSLIINSLTNIEISPGEGDKISAYVIGRIHQQATNTKRGTPLAISIDYRGLVVLQRLPKTSLNPYGFFLLSADQRMAARALAFDAEMEARNAAKQGK